jgi:hypothetical protein
MLALLREDVRATEIKPPLHACRQHATDCQHYPAIPCEVARSNAFDSHHCQQPRARSKLRRGPRLVEAVNRDHWRLARHARHEVEHRARRVALQQPPEELGRQADCRRDERLVDRVVRDNERADRDVAVAEDLLPDERRAVPELAHRHLAVDLKVRGIALPRLERGAEARLALRLHEALERVEVDLAKRRQHCGRAVGLTPHELRGLGGARERAVEHLVERLVLELHACTSLARRGPVSARVQRRCRMPQSITNSLLAQTEHMMQRLRRNGSHAARAV